MPVPNVPLSVEKPTFSTTERGWLASTMNSATSSIISFALLLSGGNFSRFSIVSSSVVAVAHFSSLLVACIYSAYSFPWCFFSGLIKFGVVKFPMLLPPFETLALHKLHGCFSFFFIDLKIIPYRWHDDADRSYLHFASSMQSMLQACDTCCLS